MTWRILAAGTTALTAVALSGCGGAPGSPAADTTETSPAAVAVASPSPGAASPACPAEDPAVCDAAARVEQLLVKLDFAGFAGFAVERTLACPASPSRPPGLPASLCEGRAAGEQVTGYSGGLRRGSASVYSRESFLNFLLQTRVDEQPQRTDRYGSGLLAVTSIAEVQDATCRECYRVELSRLQLVAGQPVRRGVSVWLARQPDGAWRPIIVLVGAYLSRAEMTAQANGGDFEGTTYIAWRTAPR